MRVVLLAAAAAAIALTAGPAEARDTVLTGRPASSFHGDFGRDHSDRHRHRGVRDGVLIGPWYESRDFDGNRSFDPDRWNDWWHDRPDRAYPRWLQHNQNCERLWWSGGGWRC